MPKHSFLRDREPRTFLLSAPVGEQLISKKGKARTKEIRNWSFFNNQTKHLHLFYQNNAILENEPLIML